MALKWDVTENNGGGLTLNIWDDGYGNEYMHSGYEYNPGQLREDIMALYNDDNADVSMWDGNDLINEEYARAVRSREEDGNTILPDNDEMYDADGNIIPLDLADVYDDHETTKVIASGNADKITLYPGNMGAAGKSEFM